MLNKGKISQGMDERKDVGDVLEERRRGSSSTRESLPDKVAKAVLNEKVMFLK